MTDERTIQQLEILSYGCIRKARIVLSPLHALIGPNDSGKSTILRALRTVAQFGRGAFPDGNKTPFDPMLGVADGVSIAARYPDGREYAIKTQGGGALHESVLFKGQAIITEARPGWNHPSLLFRPTGAPDSVGPHLAALRGYSTLATMTRFDPDCLRAPAALIPEKRGIAFADERGTGLASVFDAIINRDTESFARIQESVRALFPSVAKVGLINISDTLKEMAITLPDGTRVGAKGMSEGLLYYLGFAALRHVDGSRLFLVEEPENGLHPARIAEVVRVLREMSKTNQVVIATHSPLVVNELEGHEVSVVTRSADKGTQAVLLKDVPGFADASKVYRPGEFWVSYCDGQQEEPLLTGKPR
jgi:ABC-type uncharacterized transport system ATPase subunit